MDINLVYNKIIEKLKASDNLNVVAELENFIASAATGSEALMASAFYLSSLKHNNSSVYELIEEQIKEYLKYCKQNGLIIK
jgi:hypothetical protein